MFNELLARKKKIAVIGLGYVGLPIALEFAKKFSVIGFDISSERVKMMQNRIDPSQELKSEAFDRVDIKFTANPDELIDAHFFVVAVPTPVDKHKVPNLNPLISASTTIGKVLKKGDYVIYESTVYPGCTEEDCLPLLEKHSGLTLGEFKIGYSPERINPGDKKNTIATITKIVSGSDAEALKEISAVYGSIITAGIYEAETIKVAEAAKVVENSQRDLNISFMNELSIIFQKMGINTQSVINAAGTKWNFLKFYPGLVGGHCIGVDPYYLTHKAKQLGYDPQVILSGRRINDQMAAYVAKRTVQLLINKGKDPGSSNVLVMGITFKENVSDMRNSKVIDLVKELGDFSVNVDVHDPYASSDELKEVAGFGLTTQIGDNYDAIVVAVNHDEYKDHGPAYFKSITNENPVLIDVKGIYLNQDVSAFEYWAL